MDTVWIVTWQMDSRNGILLGEGEEEEEEEDEEGDEEEVVAPYLFVVCVCLYKKDYRYHRLKQSIHSKTTRHSYRCHGSHVLLVARSERETARPAQAFELLHFGQPSVC
eukprot:m.50092 g.50092  ORF g.50092 m.50092 type:complete len:109 (-) comp16264_c0_seq1:48-374(-)